MKILHILKRPPDESTKKIIDTQRAGNDVTIVDLTKGGVDYGKLVADVFGSDRVFTW